MCEQKIRELAYLKWEKAGYPQGDGVQFWLAAEAELSDCPRNGCTTKAPAAKKVAAKATPSAGKKSR